MVLVDTKEEDFLGNGMIIKLQRQIKKMSQEELAEGIISISYLSKIENEKAIANTETLRLLYSRLDLEYREPDENGKELCENWFTLLQDYENINEIEENYKDIQKIKNSLNEILLTSTNIHFIRYFCMTSQLEKAMEQINFLKPLSSLFTDEQQYYWNKFQGNYYYLVGNYQSANDFYKMAERLKNNILPLSNLEYGDLFYLIALTLSKMRRPAESIIYALTALDKFKGIYNLKRCFQCHVLLGISYRRILNNEQAIEHYQLGLQLAKSLGNSGFLTLVYLNLGHLYYVKNNKELSLKMYKLGLKHSENADTVENRLLIILSLIKIYITEDRDEARKLIEKGLNILETIKNKFNGIKLEIETHLYILQGNEIGYLDKIEKEVIPYFTSKSDYSKVVEYSNYLSNYYSERKHYKKALKYERLINKSYSQQIYL